MRYSSSQSFRAGVTAVSVATWLCVAPVLVLCVCEQGHSAVAFQGHQDSACGQHEHDRSPAESTDFDHEDHHQDEKVLSVELLTRSSNDAALDLPLVYVGTVDALLVTANASPSHAFLNHAHGPPDSVRAAITSTILLI